MRLEVGTQVAAQVTVRAILIGIELVSVFCRVATARMVPSIQPAIALVIMRGAHARLSSTPCISAVISNRRIAGSAIVDSSARVGFRRGLHYDNIKSLVFEYIGTTHRMSPIRMRLPKTRCCCLSMRVSCASKCFWLTRSALVLMNAKASPQPCKPGEDRLTASESEQSEEHDLSKSTLLQVEDLSGYLRRECAG